MINPAGKNIVIDRAAPPLEPDQQAGPSVLEQFELNRATCFLLHHHCPRSDLPAADKIANLHLHQAAAPELAVDRQIEQRSISQPATLIEVKSDLPNLLRFQSSLRADGSPSPIFVDLDAGGIRTALPVDFTPVLAMKTGPLGDNPCISRLRGHS